MLHYLAILLIRSFFKQISISGTPYEGKSSIWAVNHANGIVDPTVLIAFAPVSLRPLAKAPLWKNLVMRFFLWVTKAIPVARPQDAEEMFGGKTVDPDWQKKTNAEAFQQVNQALINGDRILIFPEGEGHDDPFLHPFKTGMARMAIGAVASIPQVIIQPTLIQYSEKNEFKSDVHLQYCDPVTVTTGDTSVPDIMAKVTESFNRYFVSFKTWDEKRNWQLIFLMSRGHNVDSLKEFHDFVEQNRNAIEQDPVLFGKIQTMRCMLQGSGISPCDACWQKTAQGQNNFLWFLMFLTRIVTFAFITVPVQLVSAIVLGIPLEICNYLGTSNKKYHRDVYATLKIANALWVFPVWIFFTLGVLTIYIEPYFLNIRPLFIWLILFVAFPILMFIGHYINEAMKFCSGYFRFGVLKLTFPRGLEEMMREWKAISSVLSKTVKMDPAVMQRDVR